MTCWLNKYKTANYSLLVWSFIVSVGPICFIVSIFYLPHTHTLTQLTHTHARARAHMLEYSIHCGSAFEYEFFIYLYTQNLIGNITLSMNIIQVASVN